MPQISIFGGSWKTTSTRTTYRQPENSRKPSKRPFGESRNRSVCGWLIALRGKFKFACSGAEATWSMFCRMSITFLKDKLQRRNVVCKACRGHLCVNKFYEDCFIVQSMTFSGYYFLGHPVYSRYFSIKALQCGWICYEIIFREKSLKGLSFKSFAVRMNNSLKIA